MAYEDYLRIRSARCASLRDVLSRRYAQSTALTLEIGCGHGHFLTSFAETYPETACLGIDLVSKRIHKAMQKRDKRDLANLYFLKADVREFFDALPEWIRLERVFILFPDPWPKAKHAKNRIIQRALLDELAARTLPDGHLYFRTDHEDQFAWGIARIAEHEAWEIDDSLPWPHESTSYFQELMERHDSLSARRR